MLYATYYYYKNKQQYDLLDTGVIRCTAVGSPWWHSVSRRGPRRLMTSITTSAAPLHRSLGTSRTLRMTNWCASPKQSRFVLFQLVRGPSRRSKLEFIGTTRSVITTPLSPPDLQLSRTLKRLAETAAYVLNNVAEENLKGKH